MAKTKTRPLDAALLGIAAMCLLAAAVIFGTFLAEDAAYRSLAGDAATSSGVSDGQAVDWESLSAINPDIAAWLRVDGTRIDYPVVKPGEGKAGDWYLSHDFWGNPNPIGCLYLDRRSSADGPHALVYGHHMELSGQMFHDISGAYGQTAFDAVGAAHWLTPTGDEEFAPALSMRVDKGYAPIQRFEFEDAADLRMWLEGLAGDATAKSPDLDDLTKRARRALTLVTCSSAFAGERARTLLVFVA